MKKQHNIICLFILLFLVSGCGNNPLKPQAEVGPIIFTTKSGDHTQIHAIHEDGSGITQLTASPFNNFGAHWSNDGERIIFNSKDRTTNHHFYSVVIADKHGRNERFVLEHGYGPVFSPDGDRIAFAFDTEFPGWGGKRDIVVYDLGTQTATWVLRDSNDYFLSDWSPDGRFLLVTSSEFPYQGGLSKSICVIDLYDSTRIELVKMGEFGSGRFSPDGQSITFVSRERLLAPTFRDSLFTMQVDGSNKRHIVTLENTIITAPVWSPDGSQIAFVAWNTSAITDKESIYIVNNDGTGLRVLFTHQEAYSGNSLDWRW